jgi:hypothetical protein
MEKLDRIELQSIKDAIANGYSWDEVADHIAQGKGVDISAARQAGHSAQDIVLHMVTPQDESKSAALPERPFIAGVGRGVEDIIAGVGGLLPDKVRPDGYLARSQARADTYDEANKDIGFDGGRVVGQAAGLAPLALTGPAAAASTGARVAGNAALGAVAGLIPRAKDMGERFTNAAVGAVAGGALPEVVRAGVSGVIAAKNAIAGRMKDVAPTVNSAIADALGISKEDVSHHLGNNAAGEVADQVRQISSYLTGLATEQAKATGRLDPAVIARAARIAKVDPNLKPTLGQLTRDPAVYSAEQNLAKSGTPAGNLVNQRFRDQESVLRQKAGDMADATGGQPLTRYDFGGKAGAFLRGKWADMQKDVGAAYKAIEQQHGDVPVEMDGLIRNIADQAYTEGGHTAKGSMATIALNKIKSFGLLDPSGNVKEGAHLTLTQLRDLRQSLNSIDSLNGANQAQTINAKVGIIDAIDNAVEGSAVGDAFKPARQLARARFSEFADRTLNKVRQDAVPDEKLFDLAARRNVDTAKDYVGALTTGTPEQVAQGAGVLNDTRRQLIADILGKASNGPNGEELLSAAALRKSLDPMKGGYQPEVLDAILGRDAGKLREFSGVVDDLRSDPAFNSINHSKSGALIAGLMGGGSQLVNRVADNAIPIGIVAGAVKGATQAAANKEQVKLAEALLKGSPGAIPGFGRQQVVDALTPGPSGGFADPETYKSILVQMLMGMPRNVGGVASAGNGR